MRSVVDQDHPVLERWADMADADTATGFVAQIGVDLQDDSCPPEVQRLGRTEVRVGDDIWLVVTKATWYSFRVALAAFLVGAALVALVLFAPKGILGTIRERWVRWLP